MLKQGLSNDDPQALAIKETMAKIAAFLQEDFNKFMPDILTSLINDAKLEIDIKLENAAMPTYNDEGVNSMTLKVKGMEGNQRLSMNTSALESKIGALKLLAMISDNAGKSFGPYCETIMPIAIENMQYALSRAVRKFSLKTIRNILSALNEPHNTGAFKLVFPTFVKGITEALQKEDLKELKLLWKYFYLNCKALTESENSNKDYMDNTHFATLSPLFSRTLELVKVSKTGAIKALNKQKINQEIDEEDWENMKVELAKQLEASTYIMETSGQLVTNFKEKVTDLIKTSMLNFFALNLNSYKDLSESELLDATCFFCDFIEYSHHTDQNMIFELNNKYLEIYKVTEFDDVK